MCIIKNKNKKDLTIDLRAIQAQEYLESKKTNMDKIKEKAFKIFGIIGIILYILITIINWTPYIIKTTHAEELSIKDKIRAERLRICEEEYKKSGIGKQFIYKQVPAVRCASYMGIIYAYESNFGKSRKCIEDKNCWGIKGNGIEYPAGFVKFKTYEEGRRYFAKKYWQFHYKKKINQFVNSWSMTDRQSYKYFLHQRFFKMYRELEYFYFTGVAK